MNHGVELGDVKFPYKRTAAQDQITEKLLEAVRLKKDCLIESATGTGKTLCLLSALLTAQMTNVGWKASKVFYLTRTHSQMECIVMQFKELNYDVKFALMQSKRGLCGNEAVLRAAEGCNSEEFNDLCALSQESGLKQHNSEHCGLSATLKKEPTVKKEQITQESQNSAQTLRKSAQTSHERPASTLLKNEIPATDTKDVPPCDLQLEISSAMDCLTIEDNYNAEVRISTAGIKQAAVGLGMCPYALEAYLAKTTPLVIMSYKYVLDRMLFQQKKLDKDLYNSVLIFDEAHSVLAIAKAECEVTINPLLADRARKQIKQATKQCQDRIFDGEDIKLYTEAFKCLEELEKYVESVGQLVDKLQKIYNRKVREDSYDIKLVQTETLQSLFEQAKLANYLRLYSQYGSVIQMLGKLVKPRRNEIRKNYIATFTKFCYYMASLIQTKEMYSNYVCALERKKPEKQQKAFINITFVCLSSKSVFKRLRDCGVRSIVFASGTLNEADFKETGLDFIKYFQTESQFPKKNVCSFIIDRYDKSNMLWLLSRSPQHKEVASILLKLTRCVPYGSLVFFKSYSHLYSFRRFVKDAGIVFSKPTFWESQSNKALFDSEVKQYLEEAEKPSGAIMMAVCRGKLSEGYNFKDNLARAVFVVGLPLMKKETLAYRVQQHIEHDKEVLQAWYYRQAMVAVKQAAGRLIRHAEDFGCLYFLGSLIAHQTCRLPVWVQKGILHRNLSLDHIARETQQFMRVKKQEGGFNTRDKKEQPKQEMAYQWEEEPAYSWEEESDPVIKSKQIEADSEDDDILEHMLREHRESKQRQQQDDEGLEGMLAQHQQERQQQEAVQDGLLESMLAQHRQGRERESSEDELLEAMLTQRRREKIRAGVVENPVKELKRE